MSKPAANFLIAVIVILLLVFGIRWWTFNASVDKQEAVAAAWAQVESNYQRRADLIPNLVRLVKKYMTYEQDTLSHIAANRQQLAATLAKVQSNHRQASNLVAKAGDSPTSTADLAALAMAESQLHRGVRSLLVMTASFPSLRTSDQFLQLQAQLEGTANRINVARMRYNRAVRDYNATIRSFPGFIYAERQGWKERPYFEADTGTSEPVKISFDK